MEEKNYDDDLLCLLLRRISDKIPEISLIDEDYGQLESEEDVYPMTFPCALVGNIEVDWEDIGAGVQKGRGTFTVRLAFDCYDDTHIGSGTEDKVIERKRLNRKLYTALHCYRPHREVSPFKRVKSSDYSHPGGIKVYETDFAFVIHDNSAAVISR